MSDGLPVLLMGDFFYEKVVEFKEEAKKKVREKKECAAAKKAKLDGSAATKQAEQEQLAKNKKIREDYKHQLEKYDKAKAQWKLDKANGEVTGGFILTKPKQGPRISKPKPPKQVSDPQDHVENTGGESESNGDESVLELSTDGIDSDGR